ncbi:MAG: 4Fe-4S binding protein [Candidatus Nezhaarchaeota archaeon]|nr:4Fe-4S binding protein [Candidatus Nezhaarchaeota archaeon]MCX8142467.1 4Fe-4S binding protein [Candidatus Nezhaarchaeota archaeon]MDW8050560.1 4Fe-4S binding protein [Nitrososphaerota archaeon]
MPHRVSVVGIERCIGCYSCMFACSRLRFNEVGMARSAIQVRSAGGIERGFIVIVCRACIDPPCAKSCPTSALKPRPGGGVILNEDKCTSCKSCYEACIVRAIVWDDERDKPIVCRYCGFCTKFCPHNVIALESIGREILV